MDGYHEELPGAELRDSEREVLLRGYSTLQMKWNELVEQQKASLRAPDSYDVQTLYRKQQQMSQIAEEMWRIQLRVNELSRRSSRS